MKPDTMRMLDAWIGPPLCAILSLRKKIALMLFPRPTTPVKEAKKILLVKPAEMGSTILMFPMLQRARELWPECELHFLVFAENTAAVNMLRMVKPEHIHTIRTTNLIKFTVDCISRLCKIAMMRFDIAIDLEFFSRASAVLTELSGAKATCGFNRFTMEGMYKGSFFTHPVQYNCHIHTAQTFLSMIEALQCDPKQIPLNKCAVTPLAELPLAELSIDETMTEKLLNKIENLNRDFLKTKHRIIINANSSELVPLRRWPLENFIELGKRLLQEIDCVIVLTGVASEKDESEAVEKAIDSSKAINLVGKTDLNELLHLYTLCDLMITNDSGPSHFASLTKISVITLFGPETPNLYGALGQNKVSISAQLACSPCVSSYNHRSTACNDNACMRSISVDKVFKECIQQLNLQEESR